VSFWTDQDWGCTLTKKTTLTDLRRAARTLRVALAFYETWSARSAAAPHQPHPQDQVANALERIRQGGIALVPLLLADPNSRIHPTQVESARQVLAEAGKVLRPFKEEVTARHSA